MANKNKIIESLLSENEPVFYISIKKPFVSVPHRDLDPEFLTEQGQEQSVQKLFNDYVLGRLDPRQLGGGVYDEETSEEVDPFNKPGITFEQATEIADAGRNAAQEMKRSGSVADHPINNRKTPDNEEQHEEPNQ